MTIGQVISIGNKYKYIAITFFNGQKVGLNSKILELNLRSKSLTFLRMNTNITKVEEVGLNEYLNIKIPFV